MWVAGQPVPGSSTVGSTVTKKIWSLSKSRRAKLCVEVALGLAAAGEAGAQPFLDEALDAVARAAAIAPPSPASGPRASRRSRRRARGRGPALRRRGRGALCGGFCCGRRAKKTASRRWPAAAARAALHEGHPLVAAARRGAGAALPGARRKKHAWPRARRRLTIKDARRQRERRGARRGGRPDGAARRRQVRGVVWWRGGVGADRKKRAELEAEIP